MDSHPGHLPTPLLSSRAAVTQVPKVFSGKEIRSHILDAAFDARLIAGAADAGGVHSESPSLGIFAKCVVELRVGRISLIHDGLHVVRDHHREHPTKEHPRRFEPGDHLARVCR
ncbi:hypothetical protein MTIM_15350 [Mycobacterium timonense]|uniref:Uncharacterized protein n=1 Tax=Mycobacterium timonense TaxID=701043 RepID=A0A7I9Z448_9MYCO|nr:hypothetical protein MTIM_15350 [Mycobacterium timonense]